MVIIQHLTEKTAEQAIILTEKIFPINYVEPRESIEASLDPKNFEKFNKKLVEELQEPPTRVLLYWVAFEKDSVVGITGIYERVGDPLDLCWLGWYCVDPVYRGKGIGTALLDFTLDWARSKGRKTMMLYTSTDPAESLAHEMYLQRGFTICEEMERIPEGNYEIFFMECQL